MEIVIEKPIEKIVYKNLRSGQDVTLEDGVIFSKQDLIPPMRDRFTTGLTNKEPHIGFRNEKGAVFIPIKDIISLDYY